MCPASTPRRRREIAVFVRFPLRPLQVCAGGAGSPYNIVRGSGKVKQRRTAAATAGLRPCGFFRAIFGRYPPRLREITAIAQNIQTAAGCSARESPWNCPEAGRRDPNPVSITNPVCGPRVSASRNQICHQRWHLLWLLLVSGCSDYQVDHPVGDAPPTTSATTATTDWSPTLTDLDGRQVELANDPSVKAIALVFILPDCPICNAYIPALNRLHQSLLAGGVQMILVHADAATTADNARQHAREYQIQSPVILDPHHAWVSRAGASTAPEAAVFSPAGELLYRGRIDNQYAGLGKRRATVTSHDLRDALEAVLAGQPIKEPRTEAIGCLIPEYSPGD